MSEATAHFERVFAPLAPTLIIENSVAYPTSCEPQQAGPASAQRESGASGCWAAYVV
jgi:hypothetical protein